METFYKCSLCGSIYPNPEDADLCEKLDRSCDCRVSSEHILFEDNHVVCKLDYLHHKIVVVTRDSKVEYPMNNCPLCGRPLIINRRAIHGMIL